MKVFFDTNVLVAAFATRGLCTGLFAHVLLEHELIVAEVVLDELRETVRTKIKLPKKSIDEIEKLLKKSVPVVSADGFDPAAAASSERRAPRERGAREGAP